MIVCIFPVFFPQEGEPDSVDSADEESDSDMGEYSTAAPAISDTSSAFSCPATCQINIKYNSVYRNSGMIFFFARLTSLQLLSAGRCDMAFIEPMHRNKPNITYLLVCRISTISLFARLLWSTTLSSGFSMLKQGCAPLTYDLCQIDGLVKERRNSIANALELRLSCTNPSR